MLRATLLPTFGLLPLWLTLWIVYSDPRASNSASEYWSAAPWLFIFGAAASCVTWFITARTVRVFTNADGPLMQRIGLAAATLAGLWALVVFAIFLYQLPGDLSRAAELKRQDRVIQYVGRHPVVAQSIPQLVELITDRPRLNHPDQGLDYLVHVTGRAPTQTAVAVVRLSTHDGGDEFRLRCLRSSSMRDFGAFADYCAERSR